ncbi:MAG: TadE/TadG family type IV pilus assembly protein [Acidimicrobiales bacterium]
MRRGVSDEGQAAVELALVLPLVLAVLLAIVQVALLARDQVLVIQAAREAAREAAVNPDLGAARDAAVNSSSLAADRLEVTIGKRGAAGSHLSATVRYRYPTDVPLVGVALGEIVLEAKATMRVER